MEGKNATKNGYSVRFVNLILYFLGFIFIIAGIGNLLIGDLIGTLFLICGFLLLPIIFYWIKLFFKTDNYKRNYIIIYLTTLLILVFCIPVSDITNENHLESQTLLKEGNVQKSVLENEKLIAEENIVGKPQKELVNEAVRLEGERKEKELKEFQKYNHKITFPDADFSFDLKLTDIQIKIKEHGFTSQEGKYGAYVKEAGYTPTIYFEITNPNDKEYNISRTFIGNYIRVNDNSGYESLPYFRGCKRTRCYSVLGELTFNNDKWLPKKINFQPNETKRFKLVSKMFTEDIKVIRFGDFYLKNNKELWFYIDLRDKKVVRKIIENSK